MGEAAFSVVVVCSIAEVEAVKANAGCFAEVEVGEVLFAGADHQAGPAPQEWRQVDRGSEDHGQVADEERGKGGHQEGQRLRAIFNNAGYKWQGCIFL